MLQGVVWLAFGMVASCDSHEPVDAPMHTPAPASEAASNVPNNVSAAQQHAAQLEELVVSSLPLLGQAKGQTVFHATLAFNRATPFQTAEAHDARSGGRWFWLRLPGCMALANVPAIMNVGAGGILSIRTRSQRDATEVGFALQPDVEPHLSLLAEPFRLQISFYPPKHVQKLHQGSDFTVILDPGHGGSDTGAHGPGADREARLALDIATRTRAALMQRHKGLLVLMTRERDESVALEKRAEMANRFDADLFVSIHLNAMDDPKEGGAATFVLDTTNDRHSVRLAARENGVTEAQVSGLQTVLASLQRTRQMPRSELLARSIQTHMLKQGRTQYPQLKDRGMRRALFFVLASVHMPAVLVEASFMTHPDEARMLNTRRYRAALAQGIADGIFNYLMLPQSGWSP